jgi:hypothetical protein
LAGICPLRVDRLVAKRVRQSFGQRLGKVSDAWERFQDVRGRDAVYGYLSAVFALVKRYGGRRRTKRLVHRAFKFAGLPLDKHADPFSAVIRCTSDGKPDSKTISKWARALRYVARVKKPPHRVTAFMKSRGGVNACAGFVHAALRPWRICLVKYAGDCTWQLSHRPTGPDRMASPGSCPDCRESDIRLETIGSIDCASSQVRYRSIRVPPNKPVHAQRRIRGV